jgi:hypothetical protein
MSTASQTLADSTPEQQGAAQPFHYDEDIVGTIPSKKAVGTIPSENSKQHATRGGGP